MIRNVMIMSRKVAFWNEIIEFGVRVNPKSLKADAEVNTAHQTRPWETANGTGPYAVELRIQGMKQIMPKR